MPTKLHSSSLRLVETINGIIGEYGAAGFTLTLRQAYYQLVARGVIENNERSYKRTGDIINTARLAGLIDWDAIVDRTRYVRQAGHFASPADAVTTAAATYAIDKWADQPNYVECWVEKDALIDVVQQAASPLDVPCFSTRGYPSQSEMYAAAGRFKAQAHRDGRYIIHLGDHDPSGVDMTRDITARLALFGADVTVRRAALTYDQIEAYSPPPNPAKTTDSRSTGYIAKYGCSSWELDALDPQVLADIVTHEVTQLMDRSAFAQASWRESLERMRLERLARAMDDGWDLSRGFPSADDP